MRVEREGEHHREERDARPAGSGSCRRSRRRSPSRPTPRRRRAGRAGRAASSGRTRRGSTQARPIIATVKTMPAERRSPYREDDPGIAQRTRVSVSERARRRIRERRRLAVRRPRRAARRARGARVRGSNDGTSGSHSPVRGSASSGRRSGRGGRARPAREVHRREPNRARRSAGPRRELLQRRFELRPVEVGPEHVAEVRARSRRSARAGSWRAAPRRWSGSPARDRSSRARRAGSRTPPLPRPRSARRRRGSPPGRRS